MENTKHILMFGESIYLAAIESALSPIAGFEIIRGDMADRAELPSPDTVIVTINGDLAPALAFIETYPNTPVIALDVQTHVLTMLSGEQTAVHTTQDLIDAIMR